MADDADLVDAFLTASRPLLAISVRSVDVARERQHLLGAFRAFDAAAGEPEDGGQGQKSVR